MLATVTCRLDSGNPLFEDSRKESLITRNRMRLDLNYPSLLGFPVFFSKVLSAFRAFLCQETIPHRPES